MPTDMSATVTQSVQPYPQLIFYFLFFTECPDVCIAVEDPVCGSDGITYQNPCKLKAAKCNQKPDLTVVYQGECQKPGQLIANLQLIIVANIYQIICHSLSTLVHLGGICHFFLKRLKGLISSYLILVGKCVEDASCDVLGTKNECPNGVCYNG